MSRVVVDTNFFLECAKNKVDLFEELLHRGDRVLIPVEVISEIERLRDGTKALKFREDADLALKLLKTENYEKVSAPGRYVDVGLKKFCEENPEVVLATMDKGLKKAVKNRKLVLRNRKKLELQ